jgi:DNA-binding MarR family transcriptional regulator
VSGQKFAQERALKQPGHGLTPTELLVLRVLTLWADSSGHAWPSSATVAAAAGVTDRTVRRALTRAEALGWIEAPEGRKGGHRSPVCWRLTVPTRADTGVPPEEQQ